MQLVVVLPFVGPDLSQPEAVALHAAIQECIALSNLRVVIRLPDSPRHVRDFFLAGLASAFASLRNLGGDCRIVSVDNSLAVASLKGANMFELFGGIYPTIDEAITSF